MHEYLSSLYEMSRLCNLRFYSIIKSVKNSETFLSNPNLRRINGAKNIILYQSGTGYAQLCCTLERHICPLYKLSDIFTSKEFRTLLTRTKIVFNRHDINCGKKYYKNLGFVLSGIGLIVALCEASNVKNGTYYFLL